MTDITAFRPPGVIAEELARFLERQIVYLELEPGARLVEEEVGRRYGVSRSPVREALRILEEDGLVQRTPRRGIWVSHLSLEDADEVYACRVALESLAAESAARHTGLVATDGLHEALATLRRARKDVRRYFEANVAFTFAVREMAGNRTLARLLDRIGKQGQRYRYFAYVQHPELIRTSIEGNYVIAKAICAGDAGTAREVTESLIRNSWEQVRQSLSQP